MKSILRNRFTKFIFCIIIGSIALVILLIDDIIENIKGHRK